VARFGIEAKVRNRIFQFVDWGWSEDTEYSEIITTVIDEDFSEVVLNTVSGKWASEELISAVLEAYKKWNPAKLFLSEHEGARLLREFLLVNGSKSGFSAAEISEMRGKIGFYEPAVDHGRFEALTEQDKYFLKDCGVAL
jgi:hypothetical protein